MDKQIRNHIKSCCDANERDLIRLFPNSEAGFKREDIVKKAETLYFKSVDKCADSVDKNKAPLIVKMPGGEQALKILIKKRFLLSNKKYFLNFLKELLENDSINFIRGVISYDEEGKHVFINLHSVINSKNIPIMSRIYFSYDKLASLFKHKSGSTASFFCETKSKIFPIDNMRDESWRYFFTYLESEENELPFAEADLFVNSAGNVKICFSCEKVNVLTREIYAKDLDEGLAVLRKEMKNLGFDIKVAEKRKVRSFK